MKTQQSLGCLVVLGMLATAGCMAPVDERVAVAEEPEIASNGLTINGLTINGLTINGLTINGLTINGLTSQALSSNPLVENALQDPNARDLLKYIVSCALPEGAQISIPSGTYKGGLGLAPEWGKPHGHCDQNCQEWVSACVLARVDYLGEDVVISVRGQNDALQTSASEAATYTHREATYYGNIFKDPQRRFMCLPPGVTDDPRVCGPSVASCVMQYTGSCADVCQKPTKDGAYRNCRAPGAGDDDDDGCGDDDNVYHGSITVYLKP